MRRWLARWRRRRRGADGFAPALVREVVALVAQESGDAAAQSIVVIGEGNGDLIAALREHSAGWQVVEAPRDIPTRNVQLTLTGPFDVVIDRPAVDARLFRFRHTFFHLRPGGIYVVPGGAVELGEQAGPFGQELAAAAALPEEDLRSGKVRSLLENQRLAWRMHVGARAVGEHLVLSHDLTDVHIKLDEPQGNAWIDQSPTPHRVLHVIPAATPPDARVIVEGPENREPPMDRPVTTGAISLRDYRDVVVDVEQLVLTDRVVLPDTYRHNQWERLLNLGVVDVAPRFGVPMRPLPADLPRLEGTYLHLDNEIRGHFGHTMTEVLSRMWSWPAALEIDPDVRVLMTAARLRPEIAEWEFHFYEACGIPRDRIVKVDHAVRVERLLSGTPMFSNPQFVHPRIVDIWDRVGDTLAAQAEEREDRPRRIFIARRITKRSCTNAEEVEAIFAAHGFEMVYPEDYPLGEQVAMFRAADVVGGYAGSGMFHIAFVPHPQHVIQVGSDAYTPRNEVLMAAIRGHRIDAIVSKAADRRVQSAFTVDLEREGPYLRSVLGSLGPLPGV